MGVLEETFGYRYPSVYIWDGTALQLGAQRNYRFPIQTVDARPGRSSAAIVRTREAVFLPDARSDPEFLSADPDVVSEISIPLQTDGELLGILNVETSGDHRLDEDDFATMQIVADRLAAALALGRERQKLTERAALLDRLTTFATVLGSSLDPATMDDEVANGAERRHPGATRSCSSTATRRPASSSSTPSPAATASVIGEPDRARRGHHRPGDRARGPSSSTDRMRARRASRRPSPASQLPDALAAMSAPMVIGDEVVGRRDLAAQATSTRPFTAQEQEIAALLAGKVGLALANARLHQKTRRRGDHAIR